MLNNCPEEKGIGQGLLFLGIYRYLCKQIKRT